MSSPLFEPLWEKRASIDPSVGQTQEPTLIGARPALRLGPLEDEARAQKMAACAKVAFTACTTPLITALGAFDKL